MWRFLTLNNKKQSLYAGVAVLTWLLAAPVAYASSGYQATNRTSGTALDGMVWHAVASSKSGKSVVAAGYGSDIYTSADYGAHWKNRTSGTSASGRDWNSIAMSSDGRYMTASVVFGDLWTSSDSGTTWRNRTDGTSLSGHNWLHVASSTSGQYVVAVDYSYVYRSKDYGVHWTKVSNSLGTRAFNSVATSSDGQYITATEDTTNVYGSSDAGKAWKKLTSDPSLDSVVAWHVVTMSWNARYVIAAAYNGDLYRSGDYGAHWTNVTTGTGLSGQGWHDLSSSASGQYVVAVSDNSNIYTSQDYGRHWTNNSAAAPLSGLAWGGVMISASGQRIVAGTIADNIHTFNNPSLAPTKPVVTNHTAYVPISSNATVNVLDGASGYDVATLAIVSGPSHGTAVDPPGDITYTPDEGYSGTDTLVYQLCAPLDDTVCSQATLSFGVGVTPPDTGFGQPRRANPLAVIIATGAVVSIGIGFILLRRARKLNH